MFTSREEEATQLDIPEELKRREERLAAIGAATAKIEARARARYGARRLHQAVAGRLFIPQVA